MCKIIIALFVTFGMIPVLAQSPLPEDPVEHALQLISEKIEQKNWQAAEDLNEQLADDYPKLKLSDILSELIKQQQSIPVQAPETLLPTQDEFIKTNLFAELSLRLNYRKPYVGVNTSQNIILKLADNIQYAVLVDISLSRLYLLENQDNKLTPIADYYIGIGKQGVSKTVRGDHRTPLGVYTVTEYIPDHKLPELYGIGSFPIDYPNTWDKRLGHTGSGIWLHGVPRTTYSRGPRSSRGCVTISNQLFSGIKPYINVGQTPLVIAKSVQWQNTKTERTLKTDILNAIRQWKNDWQSLDTNKYLGHYHKDFTYPNGNLKTWAKYKQAINRHKTFINIDISDISIFQYPLDQNLILVRYFQSYRSDRFNSHKAKELYWKKENNTWKIIDERVL